MGYTSKNLNDGDRAKIGIALGLEGGCAQRGSSLQRSNLVTA
jgi:hypothetical protein